jgi:uroporphyrin-3 C-methyltransferase
MSELREESLPRQARTWGSRLGWPALLISVIALAIAATTSLDLRQRSRQASETARKIDAAEIRLTQLEGRIDKDRAEIGRLAQTLGDGGQPADSVTGRVARVEDSLAQLSGSSAKARLNWLLSQAEYYARAANAQENLAGDPVGALAALQLADDYLRDTADPRFASVRQRLAAEIASLRALPRIDREGIALRLATISADLPKLPRKTAAPDHFAGRSDSGHQDMAGTTSGWQRVREAFRDGLFRLVSIRRSDPPVMPLMTDEGLTVLLRGLELELQMARLSVLKGDAMQFQASLHAVAAGLRRYFDVSAPPAAAVITALDELASTPIPKALPDISGSLTELRRVRDREFKP